VKQINFFLVEVLVQR